MQFVISKSKIAGVGLFSGQLLPEKTPLFKIGWYEKLYHEDFAGRFINHSPGPNIEIVCTNGKIYTQTIRPVQKGEELLLNYADSEKKLAEKGIKVDFMIFRNAKNHYNRLDEVIKKSKIHIGTRFIVE